MTTDMWLSYISLFISTVALILNWVTYHLIIGKWW